ncbi:hypothetical protein JQM66_10640 [Oscillibacter valericigenes]|nr:hypothetical protein [Oscillibacter valericigenes]
MPNWKTDGCYGELLMSSSPSAANEQHFFRVQSRVAVTPGKRKLKGHPCSFRVLVASQQSKRETQMPFRRISMMPRTVVLFCIENDAPFLQRLLQERLYHTQRKYAPFIRSSRTA